MGVIIEGEFLPKISAKFTIRCFQYFADDLEAERISLSMKFANDANSPDHWLYQATWVAW